jgi:addiction module RelE/StbE family toxin
VKLDWTEAALADRDGIYDYIEPDNPRAALALDERFRDLADRLTSHPLIGRPGRVQNTRELVAHRNYILVYEIEEPTVRIPRVLHSARRWPQD